MRKTGERFWGLSEMTPLRDAEGRPTGFVKLMRDRTFEHDAQEALRLSAEQLSRAQVAGGVGLFSVDIVANTITGTDEFCRLFGVPQRGRQTCVSSRKSSFPKTGIFHPTMPGAIRRTRHSTSNITSVAPIPARSA
ncbi:hypothetical protein ACFSLT_00885 [Novosphingobium resinovorum]